MYLLHLQHSTVPNDQSCQLLFDRDPEGLTLNQGSEEKKKKLQRGTRGNKKRGSKRITRRKEKCQSAVSGPPVKRGKVTKYQRTVVVSSQTTMISSPKQLTTDNGYNDE